MSNMSDYFFNLTYMNDFYHFLIIYKASSLVDFFEIFVLNQKTFRVYFTSTPLINCILLMNKTRTGLVIVLYLSPKYHCIRAGKSSKVFNHFLKEIYCIIFFRIISFSSMHWQIFLLLYWYSCHVLHSMFFLIFFVLTCINFIGSNVFNLQWDFSCSC